MKIPENTAFRSEHLLSDVDQVAADFPPVLQIHETGFPTDGAHLYAIRRSVQADASIGDSASELYNGALKTDDKLPIFQATEGHGIYAANHRQATYVPGIKGSHLYVLRVPLGDSNLLNTDRLSTHEDRGQQIAALLHQTRGALIGVPNPGPKNWDTLYGAADVVTFRPMTLARLIIGKSVSFGETEIPPRWAVFRNPESATIVAKGHMRTN